MLQVTFIYGGTYAFLITDTKQVYYIKIVPYWFAPGAWLQPHVPEGTGSGKVSVGVCLKSILRVTPLNAGELKV